MPGSHRRGRGVLLLACASSVALALAVPAPAGAYTLGNHAEITRAALPWEPLTEDQIASPVRGAVVASDVDPAFRHQGPMHCDNADWFPDGAYPRTIEDRNTELTACATGALAQFEAAVAAADGLVDEHGRVPESQTGLRTDCVWNGPDRRAKCEVIRHLGLAWHAVEDFYAHSNWADVAGSGSLGITNPAGLERPEVAPFFAFSRYAHMSDAAVRQDIVERAPDELTTGCYEDLDSAGVEQDCTGRVSHADLAKDFRGMPRTRADHNFDRAAVLAQEAIGRQWADFRDELRTAYPGGRGERMVCALVHDAPWESCR
ncbi:HET-C-related protein [Streptomyces sp. NPDC101118]|uniref:HET-C-related protein n=1 Tax=Streptomyces sp. NPDC101118 TaxID=3366109 RepID=UPI0038048E0E